MEVLVCPDDNYVFPTMVMLRSLIDNSNEKINLHIIPDCRSKNLEILRRWFEKWGGGASLVYYLGDNDYKAAGIDSFIEEIGEKSGYLTKSAFNRLFAANLLSEKYKKILYLDGDLVVCGEIDAFWKMEIEGYSAIVVEGFTFADTEYIMLATKNDDRTKEIIKHRECFKKEIGIFDTYTKYFNSGVMLMNLDYLREIGFLNRICEETKKLSECPSDGDQTLLNRILKDSVKYAPYKYNLRPNNYHISNKDYLKEYAVVLHYTTKPWNDRSVLMGEVWLKNEMKLRKEMKNDGLVLYK